MIIKISRIAVASILLAGLNIGQLAAQESKAITVGDNLPDFVIPKIIRWNKQTANTAEFKEKLLIIDFWATHCGSCVEAMPHMQELQNKYGLKVMILPVTDQDEKHISEFMKTNRYMKNITLPSVVEDKLFRQLFPYTSIPHEIWVYKGKVIGITFGSYVNTANIDAILEGRTPNLPLKYDFDKFDANVESLFKMDTSQINPKTLTYAAISGFRWKTGNQGVYGGSGLIRNQENKTIRFYSINGWIYQTYFSLLQQVNQLENKPPLSVSAAKVVWEVADRSKYRYLPELGIQYDWMMANTICFESVQHDKGQSDADVYRSVLKDMDRLFGLNVRWEKRKETVFIARNSKANGETEMSVNLHKPWVFAPELLSYWNSIEDRAFLFDETVGLKDKKINFHEGDEKDISIMKAKLKLCGIELTQEEREIDKLVFSEVGFKKSVSK